MSMRKTELKPVCGNCQWGESDLDLKSPYCMLDGHRIITDDEGCEQHHYDIDFKSKYDNIDEIQDEVKEAIEKAKKQRLGSGYEIG